MTYIFYLILDILFTLICYVTNPIVVLFSNEHGELPYSLRWWQTVSYTHLTLPTKLEV